MEDEKDGGKPTANRATDTFKQHYAGTFIAKRYRAYNNPITETQETCNSEREPFPMEVERCLAWIRRNHSAVTAITTVGIFLVTAVYAVFAALQWRAMQSQLREMQALHPQAMVAIDGNKLTGDLSFVGGYPMINTSYSVKNYGSGIAINEVDGAIPFVSYDMNETWKLFKLQCRPGEPDVVTHDEIIDTQSQTIMPPGMVAEGRQGDHKPQALMAREGDKQIPFVVIRVCIEYQGQTDARVHHSRYLYIGTWGIPPIDMKFNGWAYRKIESFHLDRAEAD